MLKLNAGFSRKVGEPNYGSRGAVVNLELEVESSLINDPEALTGRIRSLFDLARRSVDEELNGSQLFFNSLKQRLPVPLQQILPVDVQPRVSADGVQQTGAVLEHPRDQPLLEYR